MANKYRDIKQSCFAEIKKQIEAAETAGVMPEGSYGIYNIDALANLKNIPNKHVLGMHGFGLETNDKIYSFNFNIGISCFNDPDLVQQDDIINFLFDRFVPETRFGLYNTQTFDEYSWIVVKNGTEVTPIVDPDVRPFQSIMVSATCSPAA